MNQLAQIFDVPAMVPAPGMHTLGGAWHSSIRQAFAVNGAQVQLLGGSPSKDNNCLATGAHLTVSKGIAVAFYEAMCKTPGAKDVKTCRYASKSYGGTRTILYTVQSDINNPEQNTVVDYPVRRAPLLLASFKPHTSSGPVNNMDMIVTHSSGINDEDLLDLSLQEATSSCYVQQFTVTHTHPECGDLVYFIRKYQNDNVNVLDFYEMGVQLDAVQCAAHPAKAVELVGIFAASALCWGAGPIDCNMMYVAA